MVRPVFNKISIPLAPQPFSRTPLPSSSQSIWAKELDPITDILFHFGNHTARYI